MIRPGEITPIERSRWLGARHPGHSGSVPTMADVAARAGVAAGTVSNVLNNPHKVASGTFQRVQAAINELGFVRNDQARALASGRSNTMGLLVTDIGNSFFVDIARGAEDAASRAQMTLLLANADNAEEKQATYLDVFEQARMSGVLLAPFEAATDGQPAVRQYGRPVLLVNVRADPEVACSIVVDNEHGGYLAGKHLIDIGRTKLTFVGGPDRLEPLHERRLGVERAVREAGGGVTLEEIFVDAVNTPDGREIGQQILARAENQRPDGIVAASDLLALGIIQEMRGHIAVPRDIAIIGYDNNTAARESRTPISTIAQPGYQLGLEGMELLLEEVRDPASHQHQVRSLKPELIVRTSTVPDP